jgi:hypothetical protein
MKRFLVLTVLVFAFAVSWAQDFPSWLAGKWEIPSQSAMSGSSYEDWTTVSDNYLIGRTYRIFGNETMYFDNMEILQEGGMVVLKMSAEKGGKRFVGSFVGTKLCNDLWAFVCAEADSPSAIYYRNLGEGQVYVWTEVKTSLDVCTDFIMYKRK